MKLINNLVNSLKYLVLNDKRITIFLTPTEIEIKIKTKVNERELNDFQQDLKEFRENYKIDINDENYTTEKGQLYCKSLKNYFESKGYIVAIVDLTFLNWLFK